MTALAFAGTLEFNPLHGTLTGARRQAVPLHARPRARSCPREGFAGGDGGLRGARRPTATRCRSWSPAQQRAAAAARSPSRAWDGRDFVDLPMLVKTKGKTTTDHISPAGPWLRFRGHLDKISDNMFLGAIERVHRRGRQGRQPPHRGGRSDRSPRRRATSRPRARPGSSSATRTTARDRAASTRRCRPATSAAWRCIVRSFARIHETNLKKQGILPADLRDAKDYDRSSSRTGSAILGLAGLAPGKPVTSGSTSRTAARWTILVKHTMTASRSGGSRPARR